MQYAYEISEFMQQYNIQFYIIMIIVGRYLLVLITYFATLPAANRDRKWDNT